MAEAKPLSTCRREDLVRNHALVYGRARIWTHDLTDTAALVWRWSSYAWWKAMHYGHRGPPGESATWGIYAGCDGYCGPGDAELSHWLPIPPDPTDGVLEAQPQQPKGGA